MVEEFRERTGGPGPVRLGELGGGFRPAGPDRGQNGLGPGGQHPGVHGTGPGAGADQPDADGRVGPVVSDRGNDVGHGTSPWVVRGGG